MLIKLEILEAIRRGEITLQFRRWKRRSVKTGGQLKTRVGILSIGAITPIEAGNVTLEDVQRAGFTDIAAFLSWLDTMKPGELDKIEISYFGEDPLIALRDNADLSAAELSEVVQKLDKMDDRSDIGAWTGRAMDLIASHPAYLAEQLAAKMELEKQPFKARVQKLKSLGLTESLEIGYRLSPRGERVRMYRANVK